jgi:hypothetical protein
LRFPAMRAWHGRRSSDRPSIESPGRRREAAVLALLMTMALTSPTPIGESKASTETIRPRLLNMRQAAAYLGCSFWTLRDYVLQGLIPVVNMPPLRAREGDRQPKTLRRVLIDRADLDAFVESRKRRDGGTVI